MSKKNRRNIDDYKNLFRSELQNHYRTQKSKVEKQGYKRTAGNRIYDFLVINILGAFIHYCKSRFRPKTKFRKYILSNGIFKISNFTSIALAADWASDTEQSFKVGRLMQQENPDITIHLGDTYYVGAPQEIDDNFIADHNSWPRGKIGSLAIPGNHEYYSSGSPFYDNLLKTMGLQMNNSNLINQEASYFCLENDYWKILGLDTGYHSVGIFLLEFLCPPNARLDKIEIKWLKETVNNMPDHKGLVILSHHQYLSDFEGEYPIVGKQLKEIFGDRTVIWIFGHEHKFAVYNNYSSSEGLNAYCRCIGNGGMPIELNRSFTPKGKRPLLFYEDRPNKELEGNLGYNGYSVLRLENDKVLIEYKDINNNILYSEVFTVDSNGNVSAPLINSKNPNLKMIKT